MPRHLVSRPIASTTHSFTLAIRLVCLQSRWGSMPFQPPRLKPNRPELEFPKGGGGLGPRPTHPRHPTSPSFHPNFTQPKKGGAQSPQTNETWGVPLARPGGTVPYTLEGRASCAIGSGGFAGPRVLVRGAPQACEPPPGLGFFR